MDSGKNAYKLVLYIDFDFENIKILKIKPPLLGKF